MLQARMQGGLTLIKMLPADCQNTGGPRSLSCQLRVRAESAASKGTCSLLELILGDAQAQPWERGASLGKSWYEHIKDVIF